MVNNQKRIGIALSGGGIRATIFHLGVLKWLAENNMLEQIQRISSVSGGSLCIALVYSHNNNKWPSSIEYLNRVLPKIEKILLSTNLQATAIYRLILSPWTWTNKSSLFASVLTSTWGIDGTIDTLSNEPLWYINCTTFETGKRFRISQKNMGDYEFGFTNNPKIPIANAVATSAGFPILIGPNKIKIDDFVWHASDYSTNLNIPLKNKYIHLWDGGVYDNLGLESIYKPTNGGTPADGLDYIIISNASSSSGYRKRRVGLQSILNLKRLLDICMDQVGALRNRSVMDYINRTQNGLYFKIGNSAEKITSLSATSSALKSELLSTCISNFDSNKVCLYNTTLKKPSKADYSLILRHGYEVAKCTSLCYSKTPN